MGLPARSSAAAPGQLRATASFGGETGSEVGGVSLRNTGARVCRLPRSPLLTVFWNHERLRLHQSPFNDYQPSGNQQRVRLLQPGQWAFVPVAWSNWCGDRPWGKGFFKPYLRLALAGSAQLSVRLRHPSEMPPPRCDQPRAPSTFEVGRFYAPLPVGWNP